MGRDAMAIQLPEVVPLFPLPDHVLLVGLPTPYRIFEPRYRALVDALLERPPSQRWLAVPRLEPGWQGDYEGAPAFSALAVTALVRNIRPLEDGQFMIIVEGMTRCRLEEVPSEHPYRMARPLSLDDLPDQATADEIAAQLTVVMGQVDKLCQRLGPRAAILRPIIDNRADIQALVDRLGAALLGDLELRQAFLETLRVSERLDLLHRGLLSLLEIKLPPRQHWDPSTN
jgi:Lon protease-like protein